MEAFAAIGAVLAEVGTAVTFGGITNTIGAAMIGGAVIGAAIGGLGSLVFDYDFGEGLLYGALGGLTVGVATGAVQLSALTSLSTTSVNAGTQLAITEGLYGPGSTFISGGSPAVSGLTGAVGKEAVGMGMGEAMALSTGIQGATSVLGGVLSGMGEQGMVEEQLAFSAEESEKDRQLKEKLEEMNYELGLAQLEQQRDAAGAQVDLGYAQLEENRRQFDDELAVRMKEFEDTLAMRYEEINKPFDEAERLRNIGSEALQGVRVKRGEFSNTQGPSIYQQAVNQNIEQEIGATA